MLCCSQTAHPAFTPHTAIVFHSTGGQPDLFHVRKSIDCDSHVMVRRIFLDNCL